MYIEKSSYNRDSVISSSFFNYQDKKYRKDSLRIKKIIRDVSIWRMIQKRKYIILIRNNTLVSEIFCYN